MSRDTGEIHTTEDANLSGDSAPLCIRRRGEPRHHEDTSSRSDAGFPRSERTRGWSTTSFSGSFLPTTTWLTGGTFRSTSGHRTPSSYRRTRATDARKAGLSSTTGEAVSRLYYVFPSLRSPSSPSASHCGRLVPVPEATKGPGARDLRRGGVKLTSHLVSAIAEWRDLDAPTDDGILRLAGECCAAGTGRS